MRTTQLQTWAAFVILTAASARSAELPKRETITRDGWTIEFSPIDRPLAEKLAAQVDRLEQVRSDAARLTMEFGPEALQTRSGELAQRLGELCALPSAGPAFQRELNRMGAGLAVLKEEMAKAAFPRAIAIWRKPELIERLQAGEKIPHFTYDVATNLVNYAYNPHWTMDKNYAVAQHPEPIDTLAIKQAVDDAASAEAMAAAERGFQGMCGMDGAIMGVGIRAQVGFELSSGVDNVLEAHLVDPSVKWIGAGVASWATRRILLENIPPQMMGRYTFLLDRVQQAARQASAAINLEVWPTKEELQHTAAAVEFFRNIAEKHGNTAITRLLEEFWKLPPEQRTSAEFRQIYQKLYHEPIEAELPAGVGFGAGSRPVESIR